MKKYSTGMALNIIGAIILLLVLFGSIVSMLGYISFTKTFTSEYSETTYRMADTASSFINGDHLDAYLAGELPAEYEKTSRTLGIFTEKMNVTMIYVIKVDRTDYGRFVSIFNPINNAVDDSSYTEWELGHKRDTTNAEYRMFGCERMLDTLCAAPDSAPEQILQKTCAPRWTPSCRARSSSTI